jgi:LacI family transcriptional regulator
LNRSPTIKDVARQAQVSFKTVSRVLNGEPHVRESVRDRVLTAADALGYRPNIAARGLIGAPSRLLGLLYDTTNYSFVTEAEIGALLRCRHAGYHLAIEPVESRDDVGQQIERILSSLRLDGLILTPPLSDDPAVIATLERLKVRHVRIAPHADRDRAFCVFIDDAEAAFALTGHLLALGHRAIGFVQGPPGYGAAGLRLAGFRRAMEDAGREPSPEHVAQGDFSFESGMAAGHRLLTGGDRPTAIFAANDKMALGVMAAARELGLAIPGALSVAGFDDTWAAQRSWLPLTTVRQPVEEMCAAATDMLIAAASGETPEPGARAFDFQIVPRGSTAPPGGV